MALSAVKRAKTEKQRSLKRETLKEAFAYYQFTRQSGATKQVGIPLQDNTNVDVPVELTKKEAVVLQMRDDGHTLERVSKEFGVTRERIRQIEAKARAKVALQNETGK